MYISLRSETEHHEINTHIHWSLSKIKIDHVNCWWGFMETDGTLVAFGEEFNKMMVQPVEKPVGSFIKGKITYLIPLLGIVLSRRSENMCPYVAEWLAALFVTVWLEGPMAGWVGTACSTRATSSAMGLTWLNDGSQSPLSKSSRHTRVLKKEGQEVCFQVTYNTQISESTNFQVEFWKWYSVLKNWQIKLSFLQLEQLQG